MPPSPPQTVAILVSTLGARTRVAAAVESAGLVVRLVTRDQVRDGVRAVTRAAAFVYDLSPWDDSAIKLLKRLKDEAPELPVVLFTPVRPGLASLLQESGRIPLVWGELDEGEKSAIPLRRVLGRAVDSARHELVLDRIRRTLSGLPVEAVYFCRAALRRLRAGEAEQRCSVTAIARELGLGQRFLERAFKRAGLMSPKELLDWIVMLAAADAAQRRKTGTIRVAVGLGIDHARVRRTRFRLRHRGLYFLRNTSPQALFDDVLAWFSMRYRELQLDARRRRRSPGRTARVPS